jgi:endoglucanase
VNRTYFLLAIAAAFLAPGRATAAEATSKICLNSIGYLPTATKRASVIAKADHFKVKRASDGVVVLGGDLKPPMLDADTKEEIRIADFTKLTEQGEYKLIVDGLNDPAAFPIAADIYREPFYVVTRGMYLWRCGVEVSADYRGDHFHHDACHLEDAWLDHVSGGHERRPGVGGWHDAGDYNKYVVNAGATVGVMFRAWEDFRPQIERIELDIPESGGKLPEFLAELKWEIDWLLTMQADDGSVFHKLSALDFCGFVLPEQEKDPRYFTPWGSAATADFVAMTAAASRHFREYDHAYADKCLAAARKSYAFLKYHPENHRPDQHEFKTGGYDSPDADDRLWADAELWQATGDADVLASLEHRLGDSPTIAADLDWDWGNLKNLALLTYLASERPERHPKLVEQVKQGVLSAADKIVATAKDHAFGRPLGNRYYWGCNGSVARQTLVLQAAYRLTKDDRYQHATLDALNHLFGRNFYGRSFVTGLGVRPPLHPHDRRSIADNVANPWPGYLIGGPQRSALGWHDDQEDFRSNEIAINWNGALIYALAAGLDSNAK